MLVGQQLKVKNASTKSIYQACPYLQNKISKYNSKNRSLYPVQTVVLKSKYDFHTTCIFLPFGTLWPEMHFPAVYSETVSFLLQF